MDERIITYHTNEEKFFYLINSEDYKDKVLKRLEDDINIAYSAMIAAKDKELKKWKSA